MKAQKRQTRFYGYSTAGSGQWGLKMLSEEFLRSGLNSETFLKRKTKESASNAGDLGLIPGLGRSSEAGHGYPLQYSCLENPHGQRSLGVYSPSSCKASDTTEQLSTKYFTVVKIHGYEEF